DLADVTKHDLVVEILQRRSGTGKGTDQFILDACDLTSATEIDLDVAHHLVEEPGSARGLVDRHQITPRTMAREVSLRLAAVLATTCPLHRRGWGLCVHAQDSICYKRN